MNTTYAPYIKSVITASHCCLCRKRLEDTESVQNGIGPVCSKKYYDPTHVPSDEDVMEALGLLHLGMTEGKFPADLISDLRGLKGNARLFSNRLVYFTSQNYDKRDTVLACANIVRALGYNVMADKLEIDRVKARIVEKTDAFEVHLIHTTRCHADLLRIPGAKNDLPKEGRKVGWTVPKDQWDHLRCVLGIHFHGDLMAVAGQGISAIPKRSWYELQRFRNPPKPTPSVTVTTPSGSPLANRLSAVTPGGPVEIDVGGRDLRVRTPYNGGFKDALKANIPYSDRHWDGCWVVRASHLDRVKGLIQAHFSVAL